MRPPLWLLLTPVLLFLVAAPLANALPAWQKPIRVASVKEGDIAHLDIAVAAGGQPVLAWWECTHGGRLHCVVRAATADGVAAPFSDPITVSDPARHAGVPALARVGDSIILAWHEQHLDQNVCDIVAAEWTPNSHSLTRQTVARREACFRDEVSLSARDDGRALLSWVDGRPGAQPSSSVWISSRAATGTFTAPRRVTSAADYLVTPVSALAADGRAVVAWGGHRVGLSYLAPSGEVERSVTPKDPAGGPPTGVPRRIQVAWLADDRVALAWEVASVNYELSRTPYFAVSSMSGEFGEPTAVAAAERRSGFVGSFVELPDGGFLLAWNTYTYDDPPAARLARTDPNGKIVSDMSLNRGHTAATRANVVEGPRGVPYVHWGEGASPAVSPPTLTGSPYRPRWARRAIVRSADGVDKWVVRRGTDDEMTAAWITRTESVATLAFTHGPDDRVQPRLRDLEVAPRSLHARRRVSMRTDFVLSEPADVEVELRRAGSRKRVARRARRRGPGAGRIRLRVTRSHALRPGVYELQVTAVDLAGHRIRKTRSITVIDR